MNDKETCTALVLDIRKPDEWLEFKMAQKSGEWTGVYGDHTVVIYDKRGREDDDDWRDHD